jgi:hypothetical protein
MTPHALTRLLILTLFGWPMVALPANDTLGQVFYNLSDHASPLTSRVSLPPTWLPNASAVDYQGQLDAYWLVHLQNSHQQAEVSREHALASGAPASFNLMTAPDNCWGMFMNFGLVQLDEPADLTITVAADKQQASSFAPAFGLYGGWDVSGNSSRHGTIYFGYDNPLGTKGLRFLGDAYAANTESLVTQSFGNLAPGRYEIFVTSRTNDSSDGAYVVQLRTSPPGTTIPIDTHSQLCGAANNVSVEQAPIASDLCRWGQPINLRELQPKRFTWSCRGAGTSTASAQCYTLGHNGKQNQAPLVLAPAPDAVPSGQQLTMTISGGSGKGKLKITKGYASSGTQCRLVKKGSNLTIKTRGRDGECRFKVSKSGDRAFNDVETPSLSLQVTP